MTTASQHNIDEIRRGNLTTLVSKDIVHPMDPDSCTGNVTRRFTNAFLRSVAIYTCSFASHTNLSNASNCKSEYDSSDFIFESFDPVPFSVVLWVSFIFVSVL